MVKNINWKPNKKELRMFGLVFMIGFALIGGLFYWKGMPAVSRWMWGLGGGIGMLALIIPSASKPFYLIWMGVAFVMGTIVSFLLLSLIYFVILTPIGWLMKVLRRDALCLKRKSFSNETFWFDHPDMSNKKIYERQF